GEGVHPHQGGDVQPQELQRQDDIIHLPPTTLAASILSASILVKEAKIGEIVARIQTLLRS
ncbi:MAG: hypothetical protein NTV46_01140, partial [Verrucomicrobia bacterium]|nr:hypothetical protein [Verrucomicrobiota bacterium]